MSLLFGQHLSTGKKKESNTFPTLFDTTTAEDDDNEDTSVIAQTPHTELIDRLTDQEQRLLEELERTRNRLEAEVEIKKKDLENENAKTEKVHRSILMSSKPSENQEKKLLFASSQKKKKKFRHQEFHDISLPQKESVSPNVLKSKYDILPILTSKGQTPFEVGLEDKSSSSHILPIFKLPSVKPPPTNNNSRAITFGTPSAASIRAETPLEVQEKRLATKALLAQEEIQDAREKFGLTDADLNAMGITQESPFDRIDAKMASRSRAFKKKKNLVKKKSSKKKSKERDTYNLRKQLKSSLQTVQTYSNLVKHDITLAKQVCPVNTIKTEFFMKKWGKQKLASIFTRMQNSLLLSAIAQWQNVVSDEKTNEKRNAYQRYKAAKRISLVMQGWTRRMQVRSIERWVTLVQQDMEEARVNREQEASISIQSAFRGYVARKFTKALRKEEDLRQRHLAASKLQTLYRNRTARISAHEIVLNMKRTHAATLIQALGRGYVARVAFHEMQDFRLQTRAAKKLQALYRGRQGRRLAVELAYNHRLNTAAKLIQTRYRNRLSRKRFILFLDYRRQTRAAIKIQTLIRAFLAKSYVVNLRREIEKENARRTAAAIRIQATYRGHRGRLSTNMKMAGIRERRKLRNDSAVVIQKVVRGRIARKTVKKLRRVALQVMIESAREFVEFWDDENSTWFYFNASTAQSLWEPPMEGGYTKHDGKLVLSNGTVMTDPGHLEEEEEDTNDLANADSMRNADGDIMCVECESVEAGRHCDQCEDNFCVDCFESTHATEKRSHHTWKNMGPLRCMECERNKATRWCEECDDPYCMGCYQIIHQKGKKAMHHWNKIGHGRENNETYDTYVESEEYQYVNENTEDYGNTEYYDNTEQQPSLYYEEQVVEEDGEWQTLVDPESGATYYYNAVTGETQWA